MRGSNFSVSDSGWTKDGIARLWFTDTFLKNVGPARPQVLICDGHGSHNNVEFVELAKQNDIIVVELPSHTSNWTKPFDRTVFKSLKSHWNTVIDNFTKGTGVAVGHRQFLRLFNVAWGAALTPATIKMGLLQRVLYQMKPFVTVKLVFQGWKRHHPHQVAQILALFCYHPVLPQFQFITCLFSLFLL